MKKLLLLLAVIFISLTSQSQDKPIVLFKNTNHDFGQLREEIEEVKTIFSFNNTGNLPLLIKSVYPSCGCTTAKYTKTAVLPGKKGNIEAVYHTKNNIGSFHKSIIVYTNDTANASVILYINGTVIPREKTMSDDFSQPYGSIRFKSNHLVFNQLKKADIKTDTLWFFNAANKKLNLEFINHHNWLTLSKTVFKLKPNKKNYVLITYNAAKRNDWGLNFDKIIMKTDDDTLAEKNVFVSAQIEEDFSLLTAQQLKDAPAILFDNMNYDFGEIKEGSNIHHDFVFTNNGKTDLLIRKVKTSCPCTAASIENTIVKPGETSIIKTQLYSEGLTGDQQKTITVIANDPDHSTTILSLIGVVNK